MSDVTNDALLWAAKGAGAVDGMSGERDSLWARVGVASFLSDDEKREAVGYGPRAS